MARMYRLAAFLAQLSAGGEPAPVTGHGVDFAGIHQNAAVQRADDRADDGDGDDRGRALAEQNADYVVGHVFRCDDVLNGNDAHHAQVEQQIQHRDAHDGDCHDPGQVFLGVLQLAAHMADGVPAVKAPQHRHNGAGQRGQHRALAGGVGKGDGVAGILAQHKAGDDYAQNGNDLHKQQHRGNDAAALGAQQVQHRQHHADARRQKRDLKRREAAKQRADVGGAHHGNGRVARNADQSVCPAHGKAQQRRRLAVGAGQIDIGAAVGRHDAAQL